MSEELPRIPTEDGKIHVLLVYVEGDTETYVYLFTSKQAVEEFVVDGIKSIGKNLQGISTMQAKIWRSIGRQWRV